MNAEISDPVLSRFYKAWTKAEQEFEDFMGWADEAAVLAMNGTQFLSWILEYRRLYDAVWYSQMAYYAALKGRS